VNVAPLNRTLDQELIALARGVSLECLVCGEFVMHLADGSQFCPECGSSVGTEAAGATLPSGGSVQPLFR
jgi:Zn finger protein HypA/HybF involved in hydrogenase expression